jgi:hypothetical protein
MLRMRLFDANMLGLTRTGRVPAGSSRTTVPMSSCSRSRSTRTSQVQYARAAAFWQMLKLILDHGCVFARMVSKDGNKQSIGSLFWGAHQRFFKNMLMATKVPSVVEDAKEANLSGHSVIIGLQSTGEANANSVVAEHGACRSMIHELSARSSGQACTAAQQGTPYGVQQCLSVQCMPCRRRPGRALLYG